MNRTTSVKAGSIERAWYVVDATDVPVGRLATEVAKVLRGKHKPTFAYNADCGDFVIVINAERAAMSGNKKDELIQWHTGWPGGLKAISRGRLQEKDPVRLIERAIWG
ncbi:MAG: 50S ribosomal protein L13, partial [Fimbriimonas ginsengisoli]|nr:50S ribosomal protein L13 [Fimbriimonas ginsengisoli]